MCRRGRDRFSRLSSYPTALLNSQWQRRSVALIRELLSDTTALRNSEELKQRLTIFLSEELKQRLTNFRQREAQAATHILVRLEREAQATPHLLFFCWPIVEERWMGPQIISGILMVIGKK